ncbi:MAG: hypothetical protein JNK00_02635 [Flavipsychrobacter sp.]|nr:hypothetical protein [Flavipsychrobacter sp.]
MKYLTLITAFIAVSITVNAQSGAQRKPAVLVSNAAGIAITKDKLLADPQLHLSSDYKGFTISSYEVSYLPKGTNEVQGPFNINGDGIKGDILTSIVNNIKPGDKLYFENIIVVSSEAKNESFKTQAAVKIE